MAYRYKLGDVTFGSKEDKETWILESVVFHLKYVKTEELSKDSKELIKISISKLNRIINRRLKNSLTKK